MLVEAVSCGCSAWHGGEADRSRLGGRRRSGGGRAVDQAELVQGSFHICHHPK